MHAFGAPPPKFIPESPPGALEEPETPESPEAPGAPKSPGFPGTSPSPEASGPGSPEVWSP